MFTLRSSLQRHGFASRLGTRGGVELLASGSGGGTFDNGASRGKRGGVELRGSVGGWRTSELVLREAMDKMHASARIVLQYPVKVPKIG